LDPELVFTRGQGDLKPLSQDDKAVKIFGRKRLLKPEYLLVAEKSPHALCNFQRIAVRPIHHEVAIRADGAAHGGNRVHVEFFTAPRPHFYTPEAAVTISTRFFLEVAHIVIPKQPAGI